jgi:hypothetical protein
MRKERIEEEPMGNPSKFVFSFEEGDSKNKKFLAAKAPICAA